MGDCDIVGVVVRNLCGLRVGCGKNLQNRHLYARLKTEIEGLLALVALLMWIKVATFFTFLPKNLDIVKKCITFAPDSERDLDGGCSSVG